MKVYKACRGSWRLNIEEIEAEKANDKSVWIDGRRNARFSSWDNYFDTWQEAKYFLVKDAQSKLDMAKENLKRAEEELNQINSLHP